MVVITFKNFYDIVSEVDSLEPLLLARKIEISEVLSLGIGWVGTNSQGLLL